jgi:hypothetical protein
MSTHATERFVVVRNDLDFSLSVCLNTGYYGKGQYAVIFKGSISECREFVRQADI